MNEDVVRLRLQHIFDRTAVADAIPPPAFWEGDRAGERRVLDDLRAGRLAWQSARRSAGLGLKALEDSNLEMAAELAWIASRYYIDALEMLIDRVKPSERPSLEPAKLRGRPRKK